MTRFGVYLGNLLIALSQLLNAILGGDPDETTSSRAGRMAHRSGWRLLARLLNWIDPGHTDRAREDGKDGGVWPRL